MDCLVHSHRLWAPLFLMSLAFASTSSYAQGEYLWEQAGPSSTSSGMTAVATHPSDPKLVWLGGSATVWVSDDGGHHFESILQLGRRSYSDTDDVDADDLALDLGFESADDEDFEEEMEDLDEEELQSASEDSDDPDKDDSGVIKRSGVNRLRVIDDTLYVCTSYGLFSIPTAARNLGLADEIRLGRRLAVYDVAKAPNGELWVGTENGLYKVAPNGIAHLARGLEEDLVIHAITELQGMFVLGTSRGLRVGSQKSDAFEKISIGGKDTGLEDMLVTRDQHLLVAGQDQVIEMAFSDDKSRLEVLDLERVPGASRLARETNGTLWAVGLFGAWRRNASSDWERVSEGLFDRRLIDVASGQNDKQLLWAVSRSSASFLKFDTSQIRNEELIQKTQAIMADWPTIDEVLGWAIEARGLKLSDMDQWRLEERLAWLMPHVRFRVRSDLSRLEKYLYIEQLNRRVLNEVSVTPQKMQFQVTAYWDVMPAFLLALEGSRLDYNMASANARKSLDRIRETILPLYQTWQNKKVELALGPPTRTAEEVIRDLLITERFEADLHVYTEGKFPLHP